MEKKILTVDDIMAAIIKNSQTTEDVPDYLLEDQVWASNSKFFNQIMTDGHIFNPYLHRRFLPVQFLKLMKSEEPSITETINNGYDLKYSIKWTLQEVDKLAYLQEVDKIAFNERKKFLTLEDASVIICDYIEKLMRWAERNSYTYDSKQQVWVPLYGRVILSEFIQSMLDYCEKIKKAQTYVSMNNCLKDFRRVDLPNLYQKSPRFVEVFQKSGAYYTLKHLILFINLKLKGKSGKEAADLLKTYVSKDANEIYEILQEVIAENNYNF